MRILLFEDNPGDARLIHEMLRETGDDSDIDVAERLGQGLEFLLLHEVDVILLDMNLPDSRGLDTLTGLLSRFPHLPVVVMTSISDEDLAVQAVRMGAQDYLVKGKVNGELLRRALIYAVERQKLDDALRRQASLLDMSHDAIFCWEIGGNIRYWNDGSRGLYGFYSNEAIDKDPHSLLQTGGADFDRLYEILEHDGNWEGELTHTAQDGKRIIVESRMVVINQPAQRPLVLETNRDITDRKQWEETLAASERKYRELVETANSIIIRWDNEGIIRFINEYGLRFFGYSPEDLLNLDIMTIMPQVEKGTGKNTNALVKDILIHPERYTYVPSENIRKDGMTVWVAWANKAIPDEQGNVREILSIGNDISALKKAEDRLRASLGEKEVLLKEIHHRVKNNMQIISSLVGLQADESKNAAIRDVLQDVSHRVRSMAMVHEKLYQSTNLAQVDFAEYAQSLLNYLWRSYGSEASGIRLSLDLESVSIPVNEAVPVGLIFNELITNVLKHAFPCHTEGEVAVSLHRGEQGGMVLRVRDNGRGLPAGFDWSRARSLGLRLVQMLAGQLHATVEVSGVGGTEFKLIFGR